METHEKSTGVISEISHSWQKYLQIEAILIGDQVHH